MEYTRIYADEAGRSRVEQIRLDSSPVQFAPAALPFDLSAPFATTEVRFATVSVGWSGDWHPGAT
ncbi:MAG: hypothetical protein M5U22_19140 [Thermoleophilia bacterium]|nr:hypothetical protein [Thermoleophilia bacterium]